MSLRMNLSVLVFLLLFVCNGQVQKQWTLDDCIAYALEHSLSKKNQDYTAAINKELWQQSKRNMLPTVNISYPSYNVSYGRTLDPVTNSFVETKFVSGISGSLSSSLTLFQSFRKWHELAYLKLMYQSSKYQMQQQQYDLAFKIMDLYNQVLFNQGALTIVKEQHGTNLIQQKTVNKKVELGLLAKSDLYQMEAIASQDTLELIKAKNNLKLSKLALLQEMNLEQDDIALAPRLETTPKALNKPINTNGIFENALVALPQLQKSKLSVNSAKKQLQISRTALLPSIILGGSISTNYSDNFKDIDGTTIPFKNQLKINQSKYIGLSLRYPIFGNGRTRSQIKIAKKEVEIAENNYSIDKQQVYKAIQELAQKQEALRAELILNQANLKAKHKAYKFAKKKYEKQLSSLYELQRASNDYLTTKIEQIRLSLQQEIQQRTLDFYKGTFSLPANTSFY